MEKTLRVLGGGEEPGHSHSHSHSHSQVGSVASNGLSSSVSATDKSGLRQRTGDKSVTNGDANEQDDHDHKPASGPSKLSAYLNLFGDFVHNM